MSILRERFPEAELDLTRGRVGKHECYNVGAKYNGPDATDLFDCLQMLTYTYGNIGFWFDAE